MWMVVCPQQWTMAKERIEASRVGVACHKDEADRTGSKGAVYRGGRGGGLCQVAALQQEHRQLRGRSRAARRRSAQPT